MKEYKKRRNSDGKLVNVGNADADGMDVNRWKPRNKYTKTAFYDDLLSTHYKEYVPPIVVEEKLETLEVLE